MSRIQSLRVAGFRGVPNHVHVDFRDQSGAEVSAIVAGDNGSGKSSLVDALEYGLQGRVSRSQNLNSDRVPLLQSLTMPSRSEVSVTFADGASLTRDIRRDGDRLIATDRQPHPIFTASPIALRRADILQFWDTPDVQRQLVFLDFFRQVQDDWTPPTSEQVEAAEEQRAAAKKRRRETVAELAKRKGVAPFDIPLDPQGFNDWVRDHIYGGLNQKSRATAKYRGVRLKVDEHAESLARLVRQQSQEVSYLNGVLGKLKGPPPLSGGPKSRIAPAMERIGEALTAAFCEISPSREFVDRIELAFGELSEVSMSVKVHLRNGMVAQPRKIFSEGNLDLLALLVFLAVAKESAATGQEKVLLLDDVMQSVDASVRLRSAEYVLKEFRGWQLLWTVHDRLWQEQLRDLMRRVQVPFVEHEIVRWDFAGGPVVMEGGRDIEWPLIRAMTDADVLGICAHAGLLLERITGRSVGRTFQRMGPDVVASGCGGVWERRRAISSRS